MRGLLLLGAVLVLAGCGTGGLATGAGDQDNGRKLFVAKCGGCHTLADAGTTGTIGPNLDDAFRAARTATGGSFQESTIFDVTLDQMKLAASPMPRFDTGPQKLSEEELTNIAGYVASVAGLPVEAAGGTAPTGATGTSTAP
jgi:mono/diheme cytochrome c family protein